MLDLYFEELDTKEAFSIDLVASLTTLGLTCFCALALNKENSNSSIWDEFLYAQVGQLQY